MGFGHSAFHVFQGMLGFRPLLRQLGFKGPCATVYVLDGMSFDSLSRKLKARHDLYYDAQDIDDDAHRVELALMRSSDSFIRRVSHGANRGVRWGVGM